MIKVGDRVMLPGEVRSIFTSKTKETKVLVECVIPDDRSKTVIPIKDLTDKIYNAILVANHYELKDPHEIREAIVAVLKVNLRG